MEQRFHLFVRRHRDNGCSVSVLTHPYLATFADDIDVARADIARVANRLLERNDRGIAHETTFWSGLRLQRVDVAIRAVQHRRLLSVPMRFTVLTHPAGDDDRRSRDLTVLVPRLGFRGAIENPADLEAYVEEVIRHELYMAPLERLLAIAYDGVETVETLAVTYKPRNERLIKARAARSTVTPRKPAPPQLTEAARRLNDDTDGASLERAFQRDEWLAPLESMLLAARRSSVALIGPPGAGKTALVHELVHRLEERDRAHATEIFTTSANRIVAGMRYLGEWQARVQRMVDSLRTRNAVLHIESLAELLSTGDAASGLDIAGYLVPAMETGEIRVIIEASPEDYARAERTHPTLIQAMQPLHLPPLPTPRAVLALRSVATRISRQRKLTFSEPALLRAIDLTERFGDGSALPGSAILLLRDAAQRERTPSRHASQNIVEAADITAAFTLRTGYPAEIVDPSIPLDPDQVLARLRTRVVGQDAALVLLRDLVVTLKTSLSDPSRPLGSFLMLGPTGVGKTESALALAEYLFGDAKRMTRIDMSEFAAPGSAVRLVSDWGGRDGSLARRVREQPFGLVLFDEVEKADASVHDLLLQILGEGRLTDATGRTVSFRNTIVMLTSNLGADTASRSLGFGARGASDIDTHYVAAAAAYFRPELLNRFDHIVPYRSLAPATVELIARRAVDRALAREGLARRDVSVRYDDAVIERIAAIGFDARYGARPLQRAIEHWIVAPLARVVAARAPTRGARVLELVVRGDAVAVVPTTRPEIDALDESSLAVEFERIALREPDEPLHLRLTPVTSRAARQAEWLAERYAAFVERHAGASRVVRESHDAALSLTIAGRGARLLRFEAGAHEFAFADGLESSVVVSVGDEKPPARAIRMYVTVPSPAIHDGVTDYEILATWDDASSGARFDRLVLARAVEAG